VVATDGGGVPEIVVNGVTGLLVPMGDAAALAAAIGDLLADPDRARAMGAAGLERVRQLFTIEQTVRTVEDVYETILERVPSS
jgi:glycosyltransferase involved in cell wall biosynthesis